MASTRSCTTLVQRSCCSNGIAAATGPNRATPDSSSRSSRATGRSAVSDIDDDPGAAEGWVAVDVLAPDGWVSPTPACGTGGMVSSNIDYGPGAVGVSDPLTDAQGRAASADQMLEAGYRTDESRTIVALQSGVVTESYGYVSDGQGRWLLSTTTACS